MNRRQGNPSEIRKYALKKQKNISKIENGKVYYDDGSIEKADDGIRFKK